jgi:signal transduction histidine kinase
MIRGGLAVALLAAGLLGWGVGADGPAGPGTWPVVAAAGGLWLCAEWLLALRRARARRAEAEQRREEERRLRDRSEELASAYERLRTEQADLVNSTRLATLGSLVAGIAHELDTPLGSLVSSHDTLRRALERLQEILADERVDESELEEVRRIVRAVDGVMDASGLATDRMVGLVGSLRTFGRPDGSERDLVDVREALEETLTLVKHRFGDGIRVETSYGDLPRIECYPAELNQAFMNLLLNASQALEGEGRIHVRTRSGDGHVEVEIRDTGTGIPADHLARIFEPGFSTKGARVGMGMGLLITRQVVARHGGHVRVESEVGVGTAFTLRLPVRLPESAEGGSA